MNNAIRWAVRFSLEGRPPLPYRKWPLVVLSACFQLRYRLTGRFD